MQFRGMGFPEQEIVVTATVKQAGDGTVVVDTVAAQGRQPDHPQRRGGAGGRLEPPGAGPIGARPRIRLVLSERQQLILKLLSDHLESGSRWGRRRSPSAPDIDWSASTVRAELASLEDGGS